MAGELDKKAPSLAAGDGRRARKPAYRQVRDYGEDELRELLTEAVGLARSGAARCTWGMSPSTTARR